MNKFVKVIFLLFSLQVLLFSCGLKYSPPESIEQIQSNRRLMLEQQLTTQFATVHKKYTSLEYGESLTIKPLSYMRLDSLFEIKYQRTKTGQSTKDLEPLIEAQKMMLLADTTEILFMETNWFELQSDSILEYMIARCYLNNANVLRKIEFVDDFTTGNSNQTWARKYMKEEWFTQNVGITPSSDAQFYTLAKTREFALKDQQKNAFLNRIFEVMKIANELSSLNAKDICMKLIQTDAPKTSKGINLQDYTVEFQKLIDTSNNIVGYRCRFYLKADNTEAFTLNYDTCFQLI